MEKQIAPIKGLLETPTEPVKRLISVLRNSKIWKEDFIAEILFCDPLGARTQDPNIKSVVLYQLS